MGLQDSLSRFGNWWRGKREVAHGDFEAPQLNEEGLITEQEQASSATGGRAGVEQPVKAVAVRGKSESLEKIQAGFDRLIEELNGINTHLAKQAAQHEELVSRIDQLPKLLESFPDVVENQKALTESLIDQLKNNLAKDQVLLSAVEKIPTESAKQTDELLNIEHHLAAAADVDVQMTETFNKFNESLSKLNQNTQDHTDGIARMSRTFAASDRYLKFVVSRQNRWFMWLFVTSIAVCVVVILVFFGIILYLARG